MGKPEKTREIRKAEPAPVFTIFLIGLCFLVFLLENYYAYIYGQGFVELMFEKFGFSLNALAEGRWYVFITSIFLHAGPEHLILNMIALFFFGKVIENSLGKLKFLFVFFSSAILGDVALLAANFLGIMQVNIPTVGASAAIFGLLGAAMLVRPFDMVFYPYLIPVPVILVALLYTVYNIVEFSAVILTGKETDIAYIAHLGGLLAGAIFGFKHEGSKKGFLILVLIAIFLFLIPIILPYIEAFNYLRIFGLK